MNRKQRTVFVILGLVVILAAVSVAVIRIAYAETEGRKAAKADFDEIILSLGSLRQAADIADPALRQRLVRHYSASPDLLLLLVAERGTGVVWSIPGRSPYLRVLPGSTPVIDHPDRSSMLLSAPLRGDSSGRLVLEALYVAIPQATVFTAFRDAGLISGAWLIVSLVIALIVGRGQSEATWRVGASAPVRPRSSRGDPDKGSAYSPGTDPLEDSSASELEEGFGVGTLGTEDEQEDQLLDFEAEADRLGPGFRGEAETSGPVPVEASRHAPSEPESGPGRAAAPQGLFSPLSGLGWESYLEDRLDAELARSASFEQDLAFLMISYEGLSPDRPAYALMATAIADFFSFKDLAFERGQDGFAVILPNLDADHALRMAEEFHKKASILLREEEGSRHAAALPLYMGLSARAGRLVEASRLLGEAAIALDRAKAEGDAKIVAFKPDPDKYRLYLASKGL
jgi:GGDEF domain-containing protein